MFKLAKKRSASWVIEFFVNWHLVVLAMTVMVFDVGPDKSRIL